jgi:mRNA interferase MazF
MAGRVSRGDVWMYEFRRPDKLRPVVVLSREDAIAVLHTVMVAPVTSTIRGIPSEVLVGIDEGLKHTSAVNVDHVQTVEQSRLTRHLGRLRGEALAKVCRALAIAFSCEGD